MMTNYKRTPKIAYLLASFPLVSETFIINEILELKRQGIDITVFSLNRPNEGIVQEEARDLAKETRYYDFSRSSGAGKLYNYIYSHLYFLVRSPVKYLRAFRFAYTNNAKTFKSAPYCALMLKKSGADRIHAHFASIPTEYAMLMSMILGIPYSFSAHAYDIYKAGLIKEKIELADFVLTCTAFNKDYLIRHSADSSKEKINLVYHGLNLEKFKPDRKNSDPALILSVGRLVEKKGFSYLIDACGILREAGVKFKLIIVGEGPQRKELAEKAAQYGLDGFVEFAGALDQKDLIPLYDKAGIFTLPCVVVKSGDRDGIPNVIVEAMAMELPVVSTTVSGIPEVVENNSDGILVKPNDPEELAFAIKRLLLDEGLRTAIGRKARKKILQDEMFDGRRNCEKIAQMFSSRRAK